MGIRMILSLSLALSWGCAQPSEDDDLMLPPAESESPSGKFDGFGNDRVLDWQAIKMRCAPPSPDEPSLYSNAFSWGFTLEAMADSFAKTYGSESRLFGRAFFDETRGIFVLPDEPTWGGEVILSERLIQSVRAHIEKALGAGYADFIFFPDMGHSHLFVPQERWDEIYADFPLETLSAMRTALLDDPEIQVLYHTAEQLALLDDDDALLKDRYLMWRYFTRNPVGDNRGEGRLTLIRDLSSPMNTARDLEGHHYYGAGFNISANAKGCFPYEHQGVIRYFDLSLFDLPIDPSTTDLSPF